jgi:hypothetical protein
MFPSYSYVKQCSVVSANLDFRSTHKKNQHNSLNIHACFDAIYFLVSQNFVLIFPIDSYIKTSLYMVVIILDFGSTQKQTFCKI